MSIVSRLFLYLLVISLFGATYNDAYIYPMCQRENGVCVGESAEFGRPPNIFDVLLNATVCQILCPTFRAHLQSYECIVDYFTDAKLEPKRPGTYMEMVWDWLGHRQEALPKTTESCSSSNALIVLWTWLLVTFFVFITLNKYYGRRKAPFKKIKVQPIEVMEGDVDGEIST